MPIAQHTSLLRGTLVQVQVAPYGLLSGAYVLADATLGVLKARRVGLCAQARERPQVLWRWSLFGPIPGDQVELIVNEPSQQRSSSSRVADNGPDRRTSSGRVVGRIGAAVLALCLVAAACGGGDAEVDGDTAPAGETEDKVGTGEAADVATDSTEASDADAGDGEVNADVDGAAGSTTSFSWAAPDGMAPTTIAVSPDGSQVAIGFVAPPEVLGTRAEIVVYDVSSGSEAWRGTVDDAGISGLGGLMFTNAGASFFNFDLEGVQIVTLGEGGAFAAEVPVGFECAQFLNGAVDGSANVAYSVVPGGFCRVDLATGSIVAVTAQDLDEGAALLHSIRFDESSKLVATYTDEDFETFSVYVDPATLALDGPAAGEPPSAADTHGELLVDGVNAGSGDRVAASADGSTVALLQPGTVDVLG